MNQLSAEVSFSSNFPYDRPDQPEGPVDASVVLERLRDDLFTMAAEVGRLIVPEHDPVPQSQPEALEVVGVIQAPEAIAVEPPASTERKIHKKADKIKQLTIIGNLHEMPIRRSGRRRQNCGKCNTRVNMFELEKIKVSKIGVEKLCCAKCRLEAAEKSQ